MSRLKSQVMLTMGTNLFLGLVAFGNASLTARLLGPASRGEWAAIQTWPGIFYIIALMGLANSLVYHCSKNINLSGQYLGSSFFLSLVAAIPVILSAYFFLPILLKAQRAEVIFIAQWYIVISVPFQIINTLFLSSLIGCHEYLAWNLMRIMPDFSWLMLLAFFNIFQLTDIINLAYGYLTIIALTMIVTFNIARRYVTKPIWPDIKVWKPMLAFGLPLMLSIILQNLNFFSGQILLAAFLSPESLGYYSVALSWGSVMPPLLLAVAYVIGPNIARAEKHEEQTTVALQGTRSAFLMAVLLGIPILFFTPWGMALMFGPAFRPAIPLGFVTFISGTITGLGHVLRSSILGFGNSRKILYAEIIGLATTLTFMALLLRPWGNMGAALAILFGQSCILIYLLREVVRYVGLPSRNIILFSRKELTAIMQPMSLIKSLRER